MHQLSLKANAYFHPSDAWLLYFVTPAVAVSSFVLYLSPGALLVLAFGRARSATEWVVYSFGSTLFLTIALGTLVKIFLGPVNTAQMHLALWMGAIGLGWLLLALRLRQGLKVTLPVAASSDVRRLLWMLGASFLAVAALLPKIFWENFNLDGIEAFEFGRSLTKHLLPHWELQDGAFGFYHNFLLFAYPNHWFITLFGPIEAAVRLPFVLYLVVLFSALTLLIELGAARKLSALEEVVVWLGLALYTVIQTYNTNYEPFFADLAEMAATDTLVVAVFLSSCFCLWSGKTKSFWVFSLMTCLAGPGGLLLFVAFAAATFLFKPENWQSQLKTLVAFILLWSVVGILHELLYNQFLLGGVNNQFSAKNMLRRLYPPTVDQFVRLNALLLTSGLIPVIAFFFVRRQDKFARIAVGITLIYFIVLYLQSWTSLHQFTPIMIVPLVVFWRMYLASTQKVQRWLLRSLAVATALCIFLSLPQHFQINQAVREFGQATEYNVGKYDLDYETAARAGWTLSALLPEDYRLQYPEQPWGTDPYGWLYYASREKASSNSINYIIQPSAEQPPTDATEVASKAGVSVYVRDFHLWQQHRDQQIPRVVVSPVYEPILRNTYQFFRAYTDSVRKTALDSNGR